MNLEQAELGHECRFIFGDQKLIGNKFNLAINSPVFELMFFGPMAANEIEITDIQADDFKQMLDYIITKKIIFQSIPNAWSMYYISQKYFINNLQKLCLDYISLNLSLSTLLLSYEFSQLYNLKDLSNKCWHEILLCAKEVLNMDYHMKANTFCTLLDESCINANEEDLIKAAIKWAQNECVINNLNIMDKYNVLVEAGIFQRLRFTALGRTSFQYLTELVPDNSNNIVSLINQNSEKRSRLSKMYLGLRFRFREAYKIERNIQLLSESVFYCSLKVSCKIVVYGIAIARPHQGGLDTAFTNSEISIFDTSSKLLGKVEHDITTNGDYDIPGLIHFVEGIQFESDVPYRICVKYQSNSKKRNELLCYYLNDCINMFNNSVTLRFDDGFCGGVVRGIACYAL